MSRHKKPPRLWLKPAEPWRGARPPREAVWCIVDGAKRQSTGCGERDVEQAQRKLADYITGKFEPPTGKGAHLLVVEAIAAYLEHHVEQLSSKQSREFGRATCAPLLKWWSGKVVAQVNGMNCRTYVRWRTAQNRMQHPKSRKAPVKVSDQTERHDLKSLRAALRFYKREVDGELVVPTVTLPSKAPPRTDYFLTRDELAARLRIARRSPQTRHLARMLLVGWYTGTRPGAILALSWLPSPSAGWFDLDAGVLHRRGTHTRITNKRQPPAKIHARLLPHLRRWYRLDTEAKPPITNLIHYKGEAVRKLRRSWDTVAKAAGRTGKDGPHILRHSCCTWLMQAGVDVYEVAGYTGVSVNVLLDIYGHHHPTFQQDAATATGKRLNAPLKKLKPATERTGVGGAGDRSDRPKVRGSIRRASSLQLWL
jgi:integrase